MLYIDTSIVAGYGDVEHDYEAMEDIDQQVVLAVQWGLFRDP
jgi:hypothetical protein